MLAGAIAKHAIMQSRVGGFDPRLEPLHAKLSGRISTTQFACTNTPTGKRLLCLDVLPADQYRR